MAREDEGEDNKPNTLQALSLRISQKAKAPLVELPLDPRLIRMEEQMGKPKYVDHVVINVTDLDRAVDFYTKNFGLKVSGQHEGTIVWMNFGQYDEKGLFIHDFGVYKVNRDLPEFRRDMAGLNHIALHYDTVEELHEAAEQMKKRGVKILKGPGTHKEDSTRYVYIEDPDKNVIELVAPLGEDHPKA